MKRILALSTLSLALFTGCSFWRSITGETWVPAAVQAEGRRVAILPFYDSPGVRSSALGLEIARALPPILQGKVPTVSLVNSDEALRGLGDYDWIRAPRSEVGRRLGADFVISGEILSVQLQEAGMIGVHNGRLEVAVEVVDVAKGTAVFSRKKMEVRFPREGEHRAGSILAEDSEIRKDLADQMAERMAEIFYEHRVYTEDDRDFRPPWE